MLKYPVTIDNIEDDFSTLSQLIYQGKNELEIKKTYGSLFQNLLPNKKLI